jgi:iron(III) transport system ATP-binding protein
MAKALTFDGLTHAYDGVPVIHALTLEIDEGETVCLLGNSGCGKTTVLRLAAGLERPRGGTIRLFGKAMAGPDGFVEPEHRGVGLMFQDYALFPHLTVLENVTFGIRKAAQANAAAMALLDEVGLAQAAAKYPHMLSGGEQQRVALARALAPKPSILLMDEPFSNLNQRLREEVRERTMLILAERRATTVFVTHDPEEAMQTANRIVLMDAGRVVQTGTPEQLYSQPRSAFAARFFSRHTELAGHVTVGKAVTTLGEFNATGQPDGPCRICIRPGQVHIAEDGNREATVTSSRFTGQDYLIALRAEGAGAELFSLSRTAITPGTALKVRIDEAGPFVFPA